MSELKNAKIRKGTPFDHEKVVSGMPDMDQIIIKRSPKSIFESIVWILSYGGYLFVATIKKDQLLWNLLAIFVFVLMLLYIIKLCIELKYPEIEIKNGKICFRQRKLKLKWYVCLPIDEIKCVFGNSYQPHYTGKDKFFPIFTFVMINGQEFEYSPYEKDDEKLNKVLKFRKILADYSVPFNFRTKDEKQGAR